ncbi:uncharacterized protein LOC119071920 [Bradysia coprophila]|uniref:uncharacterized protein LOC119071920 n=1 Tax=Bradysia coprophila TaxID=38358 RepID=UPI00187DCEC9|nr:uncharacterized protein LOC119071920 [Bradysia coprophila]
MAYKLRERIFYFLDNGYWHGIRFLGSRCQIFGRIFWLIVMIASGIGMATIFKFTLQNFQEDVININVETSFLHWRNTFPAVSMCFTKGGSVTSLLEFMRQYWQANNLTIPQSELAFALWIRTYLFVSPNQNMDENAFCETQNSTCGFDVDTLMKALVPQSCSDFMSEVKFLDRPYDCEDIFKPMKTEMGQCFTANSLLFHKYGKQLPLQYGQSDKKRTLSFKYDDREDIFKFLLYVHSPEELPYFDMEPIFLSKVATQFALVETIEIVNSNEVQLENIDKRSCRFPDEKLDNSVLPYSFSSCFTDKRIAIELNLCNCTLHTSPIEYKDQYCDYKGLLCISEAAIPEVFKESYKSGKLCVESCIEMQINNLGDLYEDGGQNTNATETEQTEALVVIEISNMPTVRYVRNVAKTRLDFVVSIGGLVGLFFGASLLSLVEIVYIWLIRQF